MSKEELIELLGKHKEKEAKKALKQNRIKQLEKEKESSKEDYNTNTTTNFMEGGRGNETTSKVENKVCKKDNREQEIEEEIKTLKQEIEKLDYELDQVNIRLGSLNRLEKEIITARYIDKEDYYYIGNITYYNVRHQTRGEEAIRKMIEKIMNRLTNL